MWPSQSAREIARHRDSTYSCCEQRVRVRALRRARAQEQRKRRCLYLRAPLRARAFFRHVPSALAQVQVAQAGGRHGEVVVALAVRGVGKRSRRARLQARCQRRAGKSQPKHAAAAQRQRQLVRGGARLGSGRRRRCGGSAAGHEQRHARRADALRRAGVTRGHDVAQQLARYAAPTARWAAAAICSR